jgi:hypothetical protein
MKFNFKKISAIAISTLMTGMTMGVAAAASYPAPFVSGGVANTAIVYGTGSGVSDLDQTYSGNIQTDLQKLVTSTGGTTTVEGGESFALQKTSDQFNFNESLNGVFTSLDSDEMEFLADDTYDDGSIEEDYEQKITLGTGALKLFADTDYEAKTPTVGFQFVNAEEILNYEITYDNVVNYTLMVGTELPIMGKTYYVLAASKTQIDVLDSADKATLEDGATVTLNGKEITAEIIAESYVKLTIDGEDVPKLTSDGDYEKLKDGSYVVLNENLYNAKESGISKAVVSIGAGKMELISGEKVELNTVDVNGIETTITDATGLSKLKLTWKSYRDTFLTAENAITMPLFDSLSLSFSGLEYADSSETVTFENGETFTIRMDNYDIPILWYDGTTSALGEDGNKLVIATSTISNATWNTPNLNLTNTSTDTGNSTRADGLLLEETDRFIVTKLDNDLGDIQTMYYEVDAIENNSGTINVELQDLIGTSDIIFDKIEENEVSDITVNLVAVNGTTSGQAYLNFTAGASTIAYNKVVSDKGLTIIIPTNAVTTLNANTGAVLNISEADYEGDVGEGMEFAVTVKNNSNDNLHVSTHNLTDYDQESSDKVYTGVVPSDLASKFTFDTSADEYDFSVEYFGEETTAQVSAVYGGTTTSTGTTTGVVMVTDAEVASVSSKNLIIVGGSCINSAAAHVLGFDGATCGAAFTAGTGVGSGQYLIQGFDGAYTSGKLALVVAGYESADTVNGVNYLINKKPDTSKKTTGSTATEATSVTVTA